MKIDTPVIECLIRLRNMPEFAAFRGFLADRLQAHVDAMIGLNEDRPMCVAQGMARELQHLMNLIEQSAALIDKGRQ